MIFTNFPKAEDYPPGYDWFAVDQYGEAFFYSGEPEIADKDFSCTFSLNGGDYQYSPIFTATEEVENWKETKRHKHQSTQDPVNSPNHYTWLPGIECQQVVQHMNFNLGNVIKYVWRVANPSASKYDSVEKRIEDLQKAKKYIDFEIDRLSKQ